MQTLSDNLYTAAQIRQAEQIAISTLPVSILDLMNSAGKAAFNALKRFYPDQNKLIIFCGAGNNAGDGYVLAYLALQAKWVVRVISMVDVGQLVGEAHLVCETYKSAGGGVETFESTLVISQDYLIVDALFGIGLNRQISDNYALAIALINSANAITFALDIPSGLNADTGCVFGIAVKADFTLTFIGYKCGMFTAEAADYCGHIVLADLNLPKTIFNDISAFSQILNKPFLPARAKIAHKGYFGHVLLIGGNHGYSGAIRLAAESALRSGAGLVSIATRAAHSAILNTGRPELMCHGVENIADLPHLIEKANVVVIGPGLGQDEWAKNLFSILMATQLPMVLDADALNLLVQFKIKRDNWALTPHPGEAARLLATTTSEIAKNRYSAIAELHKQYGGVSVLKGAGTLITDGTKVYVNPTGNPGMATGGMGDVLAGLIGGLLAQGMTLLESVKLAVFVHGEAADRSAKKAGERGLLASDLFPEIRKCLNGL